jgi:hypothetical protein
MSYRNPAQRSADLDRHARRHGLLGKLSQALHHGGLITQRFLGRRISRLALIVLRKPEQSVGGGDDVLDLRAGARFKDRERVDENRLIRNELPCLFQLREGRARPPAPS